MIVVLYSVGGHGWREHAMCVVLPLEELVTNWYMTTELPEGEVPNFSYYHMWEPEYEHVITARLRTL